MQTINVVIKINLKSEILDPQGLAVLGALKRQGLDNILEVRQGKILRLTLAGDVTPELLKEIDFFAMNLLSNPVIEDYSIEVEREA